MIDDWFSETDMWKSSTQRGFSSSQSKDRKKCQLVRSGLTSSSASRLPSHLTSMSTSARLSLIQSSQPWLPSNWRRNSTRKSNFLIDALYFHPLWLSVSLCSCFKRRNLISRDATNPMNTMHGFYTIISLLLYHAGRRWHPTIATACLLNFWDSSVTEWSRSVSGSSLVFRKINRSFLLSKAWKVELSVLTSFQKRIV